MKTLILSLIITLSFSPLAKAYELAATAGVQTTAIDIDVAGTSADGGTGIYAGLMGFMDIGDEHYVRGGLLLSQRKFSSTTGTLNIDFETLNLDAPITYMVLINDMFGIFGGAKIGINVSDKCESNSAAVSCSTNTETLTLAAEVGGQFRFTPNIAVELIFDLGLTDIAKQTKWANSIMIGGMFLF